MWAFAWNITLKVLSYGFNSICSNRVVSQFRKRQRTWKISWKKVIVLNLGQSEADSCFLQMSSFWEYKHILYSSVTFKCINLFTSMNLLYSMILWCIIHAFIHKEMEAAVAGWLRGLERCPRAPKGWGFNPQLWCVRAATDWCFSLTSMFLFLSLPYSLLLFLPSSLQINKNICSGEDLKKKEIEAYFISGTSGTLISGLFLHMVTSPTEMMSVRD